MPLIGALRPCVRAADAIRRVVAGDEDVRRALALAVREDGDADGRDATSLVCVACESNGAGMRSHVRPRRLALARAPRERLLEADTHVVAERVQQHASR